MSEITFADLFEENVKDPDRRRAIVEAARGLLPDDDALLATATASAVHQIAITLEHDPDMCCSPRDLVEMAAGVVLLAVADRTTKRTDGPQAPLWRAGDTAATVALRIYAQLSRGKAQLVYAELRKLLQQTEEARQSAPEWLR